MTMRRFFRRLAKVLFVTAILLLIAAVVLWHTAVPRWVESRALAALRDAGITPLSLRLRSLSLREAIFSDFSAGPNDALQADVVVVSYRLGEVLRGRLRRVEISGLRYDAGSGWQPRSSSSTSTSAPLPFNELHLNHAAIDVPMGSGARRIALPLHGSLTPQADGSIRLRLTSRVLSEPVAITGHVMRGLDLTLASTWGTLRATQDAAAGSPYRLTLDVPLQALPVALFADAPPLHAQMSFDPSGPRGELRIADVVAGGRTWQGVTLTLTPLADAAGWTLQGPWSPLAELPLQVNATLHTQPLRAVATVTAAQLPIDEKLPLAAAMLAEQKIRFNGKLDLTARIDTADSFNPRVELALRDASLTHGDHEQQLTGIEARLMIDRISPLRTLGPQTVTWKTAKLGDIVLRDGSLQFSVDSPRSILVERAHTWLGQSGQLWAHAFRIDPEALELRTDLFWEKVALEDWLSVVTLDHASGTGLVSGRLPLLVQTKPRLRVTFGEGSLVAQGEGTLRLLDRQAAQRVAQDVTLADLSQTVQDRVIQALEDFSYDVLRFDLIPGNDGPVLRVYTKGRGRLPPQQEIGGLTINVKRADSVLDLFLRLKLGMAQAGERLVQPKAGGAGGESP
jgi:hypothetical protein